MIDRLELLDWLAPQCDDRRVALLYPKGNHGTSPGWLKHRADVQRSLQAFRKGILAEQVFDSVTQSGKPYQISGAERLGLVLHRAGSVGVFCVDLDDHTGDGGTVQHLEGMKHFFGAQPITFTSKSGTGLHLFFSLEAPVPVLEFVKWAKAWGFNRSGQIEVFPKTGKLTQVFLPNEPNEQGGDTYRSGSFDSCVVSELPAPPPAPLSDATLDFLRGFVPSGGRNDSLNKAAHELAHVEACLTSRHGDFVSGEPSCAASTNKNGSKRSGLSRAALPPDAPRITASRGKACQSSCYLGDASPSTSRPKSSVGCWAVQIVSTSEEAHSLRSSE